VTSDHARKKAIRDRIAVIAAAARTLDAPCCRLALRQEEVKGPAAPRGPGLRRNSPPGWTPSTCDRCGWWEATHIRPISSSRPPRTRSSMRRALGYVAAVPDTAHHQAMEFSTSVSGSVSGVIARVGGSIR
jgi:hypothetical protein